MFKKIVIGSLILISVLVILIEIKLLIISAIQKDTVWKLQVINSDLKEQIHILKGKGEK